MKLTKKHLQLILFETQKLFINTPANLTLNNEKLTERERLALFYFQGVLLTLNKEDVLCTNREDKVIINTQTQDSEPETE